HLRTELLEVVLDRRIDFKQSQQVGSPGVEQVICRRGALMERRVFGPRGLMSREQLKTADLTIDRRSGDISARGPGRLTRAGLGRPENIMGQQRRPGQPDQPAAKSEESI